jgi:histidine triad (HIT) family protein
MVTNCLFCKIISGVIPSKKAYEDDKILAFHDIAPQAPVHVLVIPKVHISCIDDINEDNADIVAYIFAKIPEIAKIAGLDNGYRVVSNCGDDACQSVKHLHFHILGGTQLSGVMG